MRKLGLLASWITCAAACGRVGFNARSDGATGPLGDGAASDACTSIAGLIGYWPMDAADVTGATVADRSGNGFDGLIMGSPLPTLVPGIIGDALDFSGVGAGNVVYIDVGGISFNATAGAVVTVAMWINRASTPVPDDAPIYVPISPKYDFWLYGNDACVNTGAGECWGVVDTTLYDRWLHVAVEFVNGAQTESALYIDGVARSSTCTNGSCTATRTVMGPLFLGGGDFYQYYGLLDDVRVYDRALSDAEVGVLAARTACGQ